jgi:hypothetical protein
LRGSVPDAAEPDVGEKLQSGHVPYAVFNAA